MFQDCSAVLPFILESVHVEPASNVLLSVPSTFCHSIAEPVFLLMILPSVNSLSASVLIALPALSKTLAMVVAASVVLLPVLIW